AWVKYSPPVFGLAFGLLLGDQRRAIRRNLEHIRGPKNALAEQLDVAKTFASYASCLAEGLGADRPEAASAEHRIIGEEHLREALARERGVIIATAHVGPWDA